jgi:transposase
LQEAVLCYRNEYRVERVFNRLKSRVHIAPLFVKLNAHIEGRTSLLTLGVRV